MKNEQFQELLTDILKDCEATLSKKANQYATGEDRLHNFKHAALIDNETPERALWGMAKKHLVSIIDMLNGIDAGYLYSSTLWREKLGDLRNYLILLEALTIERKKENDGTKEEEYQEILDRLTRDFPNAPPTPEG